MKVTVENLEEIIKNNDVESIIETIDPFIKHNAAGIAKLIKMSRVIDQEDLYQEGVLSAIEAIPKFQFRKSNKNYNFGNFINYLTKCAQMGMLELKYNTYLPISIGNMRVKYGIRKAWKIIDSCKGMPKDKTIKVISMLLKLSPQEARYVYDLCGYSYVQLDGRFGVVKNNNESETQDNIQLDYMSQMFNNEMSDMMVEDVLKNVDERTAQIIKSVLIERDSLEKVAEEHKIPIKGVLRIYITGLYKLKDVCNELYCKRS